MKTYLINLDHSRDRLRSMTISLNKLDIDFERVSAVACDNLPEESLHCEVCSPSLNYPHPLTRGEIACFLSHRKCWENLINSGEQWALILEDNCEFSSVASQYLDSTHWFPKECQIIHFTYSPRLMYFKKHIDLDSGNALIHTECSIPVGTSAYAISKDAALLALERSKVICEPVDNFLFGMYSDFSKIVHCWRLRDSIVKRSEIETLILGRGPKNNKFEILAIHPIRLYQKAKIRVQRFFMNKINHTWLT